MELRARVAKLERTVELMVRQLGIQVPAEQPPAGVSSHVLGLIRQGNKMAAIAAHRAETGADLAEAKRLIDSLA